MKEITIDAKGKKLGRLATEVATVLRGKNEATFERHIMPAVKVTVLNAASIDISPRKLGFIEHKRYSGYASGLKVEKGSAVVAKKGMREVLRKAVHGMLPKNRSRVKIMKNLVISE